MKVLITGICGFVGSSLAKAIRKEHPSWEIVGIDNFCRPGSSMNRELIEHELGVEFYHCDIRSNSDIDSLPKCDWVIDAAANPAVLAGIDGKSSTRQLVEHNLIGTINLLEYCKAHAAGFTLLSSSRVYSITDLTQFDVVVDQKLSGKKETPLGTYRDRYLPSASESFPLGFSETGIDESFSTTPPVSLYGSTKVASEHLALEYGSLADFPVYINRCGVMSGAGQFGHPAQGIFTYWIHAFREGKPLKYIGFDGLGHQVRDAFHPSDLMPIIAKQMGVGIDPSKPSIVNLGGGNEMSASLSELTEWCRERYPDSPTSGSLPSSGASQSITVEERPYDLPWVVMDSSYAKQVWDWRPRIGLREICENIAYFADVQPDWLQITG